MAIALGLAIGLTAAGAGAQTEEPQQETVPVTTAPEPPPPAEPEEQVIEIPVEPKPKRRARPRAETERAEREPARAKRGEQRAKRAKKAKRKRRLSAAKRRARRARRARRRAIRSLDRGRYVFPVFGQSSFSNDYGAWRGSIGRGHEGNDIFAPFGAPVLAVADGALSKVGTLPISGNRLWLTDRRGHAFFYAHLSAFSHLAVNDAAVRAGDILGFMGSTGDAKPTPPHVHFEVHPADGRPVNPYRRLLRWRRTGPPPGTTLPGEAEVETPPGVLVEIRDLIAED